MQGGLDELRSITDGEGWRDAVQAFLAGGSFPGSAEDISTHWIERGHRIREQVADDQLLIQFLRRVLPTYEGESQVLFRGESKGRMREGRVGFSWTTRMDVAQMFATGINARDGGGLVLKASVEASAIIAGPNGHSSYLGEDQFTVDPFMLRAIEVIEEFPPGPLG